MNNYGYLQGLLFFMISGTNISSSFINLSMNGFLTQWSFHRVQEDPKFGRRSYDLPKLEVIRSQPIRAVLNWPS